MVKEADEKEKLQKSGDQDEKKEDEDKDDGVQYERKVGMKGNKLSGGQKQRVAIARTVIRRPKMYLFDEATSALDTESEKIVQDALNKISQSNTSLTIAHRIATIIDSDIIFVIKNGKVLEQGTYKQLMERKGEFFLINQH